VGSLFLTHFGKEPRSAEDTAREDEKMTSGYALHLMSSGIFILPGHPSGISTAHTSEDIRGLVTQTAKFAELVKKRK
jgi:glutamate-1-semialdehyde aminotransferase